MIQTGEKRKQTHTHTEKMRDMRHGENEKSIKIGIIALNIIRSKLSFILHLNSYKLFGRFQFCVLL